MKKIGIFVLGVLLSVPLFAGGGQARNSSSTDGLTAFKIYGVNKQYTLGEKSVRLSDWYDGSVKSRIWDQFTAELAKRGIRLDLELVMSDQAPTAFQTMLASGRLNNYDWIDALGLDERTRHSLVSQNRLAALNKVVEQYSDGTAKNYFSGTIGKTAAKLLTLEDGNFYWLQDIGETWYRDQSKRIGTSLVPMIRKDWLDKIGLGIPKTLDEFYNVLSAFQQRDVNGNGMKDEVASVGISGFDSGIAQWFGLGTGLVSSIDYQAVSPWYQPHVRDYITYMNRLYRAGLLRITGESTDMAANKIGFERSWLAETWLEPDINVPAGAPKAYFVQFSFQAFPDTQARIWDSGALSVGPNGMSFVPVGSKNIDKAARIIDFFVSDDYNLLTEYGIEGYTFAYNPDRSIQRLSSVGNAVGIDIDLYSRGYPGLWTNAGSIFPRNSRMDRYIEIQQVRDVGKTLGYPEGFTLKVDFADQFADGVFPFIQDDSAVLAFPTVREVDRLAEIRPDLTTYSSELISALIMGEKSLNNWDAYISDLKRLGLDELISIYQARINRAR